MAEDIQEKCPACGHPLGFVCKECGSDLELDSPECNICGGEMELTAFASDEKNKQAAEA
jgi:predicted amidophosphoribosyltransferase